MNTLHKCLVCVSLAFLFLAAGGCERKSDFNLVVASIVEIEPIADLREGFLEVFESSTFYAEHTVNIERLNAQGDSSLINQVADEIAADRPDLVYVLGTPLAQAIQARVPEVLLVQGAATDPVSAGLAVSWEGSGRKYIATSDLPPIPRQLDLISELIPSAQNIGIIYNPGETNSVAVVKRIRTYMERAYPSWRLMEAPVSTTSEVAHALDSQLGRIDVLYVPPDNTVHAAIPVVGDFCRQHSIPFFATVPSALEHGALATVGLDFRQLGRETAHLALEALEGGSPGSIPIRLSANPEITINGLVADELGLDVRPFEGRKDTITIVK